MRLDDRLEEERTLTLGELSLTRLREETQMGLSFIREAVTLCLCLGKGFWD